MNRVRPALAAGLLLASTAAIAPAQEGAPGLLRDIAQPPQVEQQPAAWYGSAYFVEHDGALYFNAWEASAGQELWRSDGTPAGTGMVRDLCPGACTGRVDLEIVESEGILFFVARDGEHGYELWRSDGTATGTSMVADVAPGPDSSRPWFLTAAPGGVYFVADDRTHGFELWWSDGTSDGTHLVADVLPGDPSDFPRDGPSHLVMLGDVLLFAAEDGLHGRELWRTDGTPAGTALVRDTFAGPTGGLWAYQSFPRSFSHPAVAGGRAFFAAVGEGGSLLVPWTTDGTTEGTTQLTGLDGATGPILFFPFGSVALFNGGSNRILWRSDGTPNGTYPLATAANGMPSPSAFAQLDDVAFFIGVDAAQAHGRELWSTDGTPEGTHLVQDIRPGPESALHWVPVLDALGDRLYFVADDGIHGMEMWSSDGSQDGAAMVGDLRAGGAGSVQLPFFLTIPKSIGQKVLFQAFDGFGTVLYAHTPASAAVTPLRSTAERPSSPWPCIDHTCPIIDATASGVGFLTLDPTEASQSAEPWISDGRPAGTQIAADLRPGPGGSMPAGAFHDAFATVGDRLLTIAYDTTETAQVFSIVAGVATPLTDGFESNWNATLVAWNGAAYFGTSEGLFRTDGTPEGTIQLAGGDCAGHLVGGVEALYFVNFGRLWATDGTIAGTRRIAPAIDVFVASMASMAVTADADGESIYFYGSDAIAGTELWISDGTDLGTRRVVDLRPGPDGLLPDNPFHFDPGPGDPPPILVAAGGRAYFVADDGVAGQELWVSDGSPGNATLLSARHGPEGSFPRWLAAVGDRVYFSADDGVHGREPWITRGAPWDTALLQDLRPGPGSSMPRELTAWGDRLALAADDGVHGMELWRTGASDFDHDPPVMQELRPGIRPSSPMGLTVSNGRLFFFADDGVHGLEPWAWPIDPTLFRDGFESGDLREWVASPP